MKETIAVGRYSARFVNNDTVVKSNLSCRSDSGVKGSSIKYGRGNFTVLTHSPLSSRFRQDGPDSLLSCMMKMVDIDCGKLCNFTSLYVFLSYFKSFEHFFSISL